jgi:hypothetical protein
MNFYSGREATSITMRGLENTRLVGDGCASLKNTATLKTGRRLPTVSKGYS